VALSLQDAKDHIDRVLGQYRGVTGSAPAPGLLPAAITSGKLYEAWVLCEVLDRLHNTEGYHVRLKNSAKVVLKTSGGPINRAYPYFELTRASRPPLEVWTDVQFRSLSHNGRGSPLPLQKGDHHELDVVVVPAATNGRPTHSEVILGVECKNTGYTKDLLRSVLGVRRELSLLTDPKATRFSTWPRALVPADPPSCLSVYSTDPAIAAYSSPGAFFGIDFVHLPMP